MSDLKKTREQLKDQIEVLLRDYLRDNLGNWHVKPTPERIEEYLRFHMPGYTRESFAKLFDSYVAQEVKKGQVKMFNELWDASQQVDDTLNDIDQAQLGATKLIKKLLEIRDRLDPVAPLPKERKEI